MTKSKSAKPGQARDQHDKPSKIDPKSGGELSEAQLQKAVGGTYIGETEKNLRRP